MKSVNRKLNNKLTTLKSSNEEKPLPKEMKNSNRRNFNNGCANQVNPGWSKSASVLQIPAVDTKKLLPLLAVKSNSRISTYSQKQSQKSQLKNEKLGTSKSGCHRQPLRVEYNFPEKTSLISEMLQTQKPPSLIEQKKLQWAKEKEELNGLWSPWGKPQHEAYSKSQEENQPIVISSEYLKKVGLSASLSEYHLPPIGNIQKPITPRGSPMSNVYLSDLHRKSSLPVCVRNPSDELYNKQWNDQMFKQVNQRSYRDYENDNEHTSGYYSENAYDENNSRFENDSWNRGENRNQKTVQPRPQNNLKPETDANELSRFTNGTMYFEGSDIRNHYAPYSSNNMNDRFSQRNHDIQYSDLPNKNSSFPNYHSDRSKSNSYSSLYSLNQSRYQPPPAMRSSFQVGSDGPQAELFNMELKKQEKENWLTELEQQREDDRIRKQKEKEDKRPRWGDKGIGVGHFWEPSSSAHSRLPTSPRDDNYIQSPAWLERSLNNIERDKSRSTQSLIDPNAYGDIHSHAHPETQSKLGNNVGYTESEVNTSERTFLRGHNVPVDPEVYAEKEKKRLAALEHQEAIRKQIEDRQLKLRQEREKRLEEEARDQARFETQRLKELQRLAMEEKNALQKVNEKNSEKLFMEQMTIVEATQSGDTLEKSYRQPTSSEQQFAHILQDNETRKYESDFAGTSAKNAYPGRAKQEHYDYRREQSTSTESDLMTEVDHLPIKERSRSLSTNRECGTQTDLVDKEKQSVISRSQNTLNNPPSKKKNEKPRWGANPNKKQYVKQSEKDLVYQSRLKKRLDRVQTREITKTVNRATNSESEDRPMNKKHYYRNMGQSETRVKQTQCEPYSKNSTDTQTPGKGINAGQTKIPQRRRLSKIEPEPKIELLSTIALELDGSILPTSEEDSETRFSSLSLESSTMNCMSDLARGKKNHDIIFSETTSCASSPENRFSYPYPKTKQSQKVDEKGSYAKQKSRELKNEKSYENYTNNVNSEKGNQNEYNDSQPMGNIDLAVHYQRCNSPPVPAVLRRIINEGITGPGPGVIPGPENRSRNPSPAKQMNEKQDSSRSLPQQFENPIEVKLKSSRIEQDSIILEGLGRTTVTEVGGVSSNPVTPRNSYLQVNDVQGTMSSRPSTNGSELDRRKELITYIMNTREVQSELSAREDELSTTGIIEFSLRLPPHLQNVLGDDYFSLAEKSSLNQQQETNHHHRSLNEVHDSEISPRTFLKEIKFERRERFIADLMKDAEPQLSARGSEWSGPGIMEFSIRVPSRSGSSFIEVISPRRSIKDDEIENKEIQSKTMNKSGKSASKKAKLRKSDTIEFGPYNPVRPNSENLNQVQSEKYVEEVSGVESQEPYKDPLFVERQRGIVRWLYNNETETTPNNGLLSHLSYLKKGIQLQQYKFGVVPADTDGV